MAYRALFRAQLDRAEIDDIRLALNQSQPLGNERFYAKIEKVTGVKRKAKPRGRPRREVDMSTMAIKGQGKLELGEMRAWPVLLSLESRQLLQAHVSLEEATA